MESYEKLKAQKNRILAKEAVRITSCVVNKLVDDKIRLSALLGILLGSPDMQAYWLAHKRLKKTVEQAIARAEGGK